MAPIVDIYMVVALSFAVFAAITAIGTALVLGIGFERIRGGLEKVKEAMERVNKQTGYFSDAIYQLDKKVDSLDKVQEHMAKEQYEDKKRVDDLIENSKNVNIENENQESSLNFVPQPLNLSINKVENSEDDYSNIALFMPKDNDIRLM